MLHDFAVAIATFITIMGSVLAHDAQQLSTSVSNFLFPDTATSINYAADPQAQLQMATVATSDSYDPFHSRPATSGAPASPTRVASNTHGATSDKSPTGNATGSELAVSKSIPSPQGHVLGASTQAELLPTPALVTQEQLAAALGALSDQFNRQLSSLSPELTFSGPAASTPVNTATFAQSQKIDQLSGVDIINPTITGGSIWGASISGNITATDFSGILDIASGGTGTSSAPTYGKVLVGNSSGGYDLTATSSLGISGGSGSGTVGSGTQGQFAFYNAAGTTLTATSSLFLTQNGNVGVGTSSPIARFSIAGPATPTGSLYSPSWGAPLFSQEIHSGVFSALSGDDFSNNYANDYTRTNADISNSNSALWGQYSELHVTDTAGSNSSSLYALAGDAFYDGTNTNAGIDINGVSGSVQNSSAGTTIGQSTGVSGNVRNMAVGATTTIQYGVYAQVGNGSPYTGVTNAYALNGKISNTNATALITNAYGLEIANIANTGTIANTYGVHVGDITTGTQTNTPYSFFASDANALNYFAGLVGIGTTSTIGRLSISGGPVRDNGWNSALEITPKTGEDFPSILFAGQNTSQFSSIAWTTGTSGENDFAVGSQIYSHMTSSSNSDLVFSTSAVVGTNYPSDRMIIKGNGNVGIASTTPWRKFSVTGTVGFDGLTGSTGAGSLCLDANKQVVYNSASDNCLSSTRATKHDVNTLAADALSQVLALRPVSFVYNQGDGRTLTASSPKTQPRWMPTSPRTTQAAPSPASTTAPSSQSSSAQ